MEKVSQQSEADVLEDKKKVGEKLFTEENVEKAFIDGSIDETIVLPNVKLSEVQVALGAGCKLYKVYESNDRSSGGEIKSAIRKPNYGRDGQGRNRFVSMAVLYQLQQSDQDFCKYFPEIFGFGVIDRQELDDNQNTVFDLHVYTATEKSEISIDRCCDLEFLDRPEEGWVINEVRKVRVLKPMSEDFLTENKLAILKDIQNGIRFAHNLVEAQAALDIYGILAFDTKGSFASHFDQAGKINQVKILDIDQIEYIADKNKRRQKMKGEISIVCNPVDGSLDLEKADKIIDSPFFEASLYYDLLLKYCSKDAVLQEEVWERTLTLEEVLKVGRALVEAADNDSSVPAEYKVSVQDYQEKMARLETYLNERVVDGVRLHLDGGIEIASLDRYINQKFAEEDPEQIREFSSKLELWDNAAAVEVADESRFNNKNLLLLVDVLRVIDNREWYEVIKAHTIYSLHHDFNLLIKDLLVLLDPDLDESVDRSVQRERVTELLEILKESDVSQIPEIFEAAIPEEMMELDDVDQLEKDAVSTVSVDYKPPGVKETESDKNVVIVNLRVENWRLKMAGADRKRLEEITEGVRQSELSHKQKDIILAEIGEAVDKLIPQDLLDRVDAVSDLATLNHLLVENKDAKYYERLKGQVERKRRNIESRLEQDDKRRRLDEINEKFVRMMLNSARSDYDLLEYLRDMLEGNKLFIFDDKLRRDLLNEVYFAL